MKLLSYKFFLVLIYLISTVISFADETDIKNLLIHKQNKKIGNVTFTDVNDKIINLENNSFCKTKCLLVSSLRAYSIYFLNVADQIHIDFCFGADSPYQTILACSLSISSDFALLLKRCVSTRGFGCTDRELLAPQICRDMAVFVPDL